MSHSTSSFLSWSAPSHANSLRGAQYTPELAALRALRAW
eukprot:CAMPEP_0198701202 /NCGR_PEP_ID=MMETSP1468-20131203/381440_1 /TAXON_ID=1461545 /ORGANISM="Mantoniella sp, Strain CCMP1436" /LENGTH=38 /DNA_ID= /DNA_START= /DNA_END= /DNA_ORIENTATION=